MKKTIWINFALALVLMTSSSCKKWLGEGKTIVEGKVIDETTGKIVPFATIRVNSIINGHYGVGYNTKIEKQADAKGEFEFSFDAESDESYGVFAYQENRYFSGAAEMTELKGAGRNKNLRLKMTPYAWVKFKFVNELPLDTAWIVVAANFMDNSGLGPLRLGMQSRDTTIIRMLIGGSENFFHLSIQKDSPIPVKSQKTVYFPGLDTITFEIRY